MAQLTHKKLGIKLIYILNKLQVGRYELTCNVKNKTYGVVIYNNANYGIFAGIYKTEHFYINEALIRLQECIADINKIEINS